MEGANASRWHREAAGLKRMFSYVALTIQATRADKFALTDAFSTVS